MAKKAMDCRSSTAVGLIDRAWLLRDLSWTGEQITTRGIVERVSVCLDSLTAGWGLSAVMEHGQ